MMTCKSAENFIMNGECANDISQVRPTTKIGTAVDYCVETASLIPRVSQFEILVQSFQICIVKNH